MPILAFQLACPPGCAGHLPADDGAVHISAEQTVVATSDDGRREIYVSRELAPGGTPAVRLSGAMDTPMQPAQALQLAMALIAEACAASTWAVTR